MQRYATVSNAIYYVSFAQMHKGNYHLISLLKNIECSQIKQRIKVLQKKRIFSAKRIGQTTGLCYMLDGTKQNKQTDYFNFVHESKSATCDFGDIFIFLTGSHCIHLILFIWYSSSNRFLHQS